jgi:hypothetical protein
MGGVRSFQARTGAWRETVWNETGDIVFDSQRRQSRFGLLAREQTMLSLWPDGIGATFPAHQPERQPPDA